MAVKRTSNLSSTISGLDRRIKTIESGTTSLSSSSAALTSSSAASDEDSESGPGATQASAPYTYVRVVKAYIYGPRVTGNTSRAELYFESDPQIEATDTVRVQGVRGTSAD
jgi:hypothetical protein